jgi:hypothetical protein
MAQYFIIVNLTKKQYFSASVFNEGVKRSGILRGIHAYALGKLLTYGAESQEENPKWRKGNEHNLWIGAWAGDRIVIAGDHGYTHLFGLYPSNPEHKPVSIYDLAVTEFENVGGKLIHWLINDEDFAEWLLAETQADEHYLADIGYIVYRFPGINTELLAFLEQHFGRSWEKKCKEIWEGKVSTYIEPDV